MQQSDHLRAFDAASRQHEATRDLAGSAEALWKKLDKSGSAKDQYERELAVMAQNLDAVFLAMIDTGLWHLGHVHQKQLVWWTAADTDSITATGSSLLRASTAKTLYVRRSAGSDVDPWQVIMRLGVRLHADRLHDTLDDLHTSAHVNGLRTGETVADTQADSIKANAMSWRRTR
jgi:hypothetical protein